MDNHKQSLPIRTAEDRQTLFVVLTCVLFSGITLLSFLPFSDKNALHTSGRFHSLGHLLLFFLLGYVATRAVGSLRTRIVLLVASLVFGLGIELAEAHLDGGLVEWNDVFVDWAGVIAGTLTAIFGTRSKSLP